MVSNTKLNITEFRRQLVNESLINEEPKETKLLESVTAQHSYLSSSKSDVDDPITNDNSKGEVDAENTFLLLQENKETGYLEEIKENIKQETFLPVKS
ncbi:hypothetical protein ILUMI_25149 [Ignelater luminosus]|uniref:Uncharacterized protein n=1 Tax=Ignelater luminosus TaxID=2038154 RepID=A0A8K0FWC1_IGNLU|nr:hypothetical protein ILUMI_25149 [Ignelater luminosus]